MNPFQDAVNAFSSNPVVLLEFLTALPDEIRNNSRITAPVDKVDLFAQRANSVLTANAGEVLQLLIAFLQQKSSGKRISDCNQLCLIRGQSAC